LLNSHENSDKMNEEFDGRNARPILNPIHNLAGVALIVLSGIPIQAAEPTEAGARKEPAADSVKPAKAPASGEEVKDERPPGGDGSMFFKVFVSRSDQNGDGVIEKSEFRGGGDRFDQMDKNQNGKLDRAEIDELHRSRMADPLSMRQRIASGQTRRPPFENPVDTAAGKKDGEPVPPASGETTALTPLGTRITAKDAFARLDADENGKVTPAEFQRSPGMSDPKKAAEVVSKVDQDQDGVLSFGEFNTVFAKRRAAEASGGKTPNANPAEKAGQ
jgi:hypothetical protein